MRKLPKIATDTIDFPFDWTKFLTTTGSADTIVSVAWNIPTGLTQVSSEVLGNITTVTVSGGTVGVIYDCSVTATTTQGRIHEFPFQVEVKDE